MPVQEMRYPLLFNKELKSIIVSTCYFQATYFKWVSCEKQKFEDEIALSLS